MTRLERRTLGEQLYEEIRAAILDDRYQPGMELNEVALADDFEVSRGPVREALRRLASEGLVVIRPRRGAVVRSLSHQEFLNAYHVREALELLAVRLATPLLTEDDLDQLSKHIDNMREAIKKNDISGLLRENRAFHGLFVDRARNSMLRTTYEYVMDSIGRYQRWSVELRGDLSHVTDEHLGILERVRARDADGAVELSHRHIQVPLRQLGEDPTGAE